MSASDIMTELPKLTLSERRRIWERIMELADSNGI